MKFDTVYQYFVENLLKENNLAGNGGVFGTSSVGSGLTNTDSYATGDYRNPVVLGAKKKKRKKKGKKIKIPIQRRPLNKD